MAVPVPVEVVDAVTVGEAVCELVPDPVPDPVFVPEVVCVTVDEPVWVRVPVWVSV